MIALKIKNLQDQLLTLLSSSQQPSSPGGGGNLGNLGNLGNNLGSSLGSSPPSIFTTRQPSLLPTLSRRRTTSNLFSSQNFTGSASGPQSVFGTSPMGLLPTIANGEKKPPLLSHKLTGAEITAVRQLITGYRSAGNIELNCEIEDSHHFSLRRG